MAISRLFANFRRNLLQFDQYRSISLTATKNVKQIQETIDGNTITVEAVYLPEDKEHLKVKPKETGACALCSLDVDVKHTDVLILKQFVRNDGCMLPRRITGLCRIQQKRVSIMVAMAHKAGLMGNLKPKSCKHGPRQRYQWKAFNTYFDETTIKHRYHK